MFNFKKLLAKYLREIADRIDCGTSDVTEEEAIETLRFIAHDPLSKEQACRHLNLSRSRFDTLIREGVLPKGKKRTGFKEKVWYRDELDLCRKK